MAAIPRLRARGASLLLVITFIASACGAAASPSPLPTVAATPSLAPTLAPTATPAPAFPVTITDDEGTAVTIAAKPVKIVSLTPAATETLFAIGAGAHVVAKVEDITPYPPAADNLPVVATYKGVDVEKIVSLKADLVIAGGLGFTPPAAVAQLRSLGIPVVVLYASSVAQALAGIRAVGTASGNLAEATALTTSMQAEFDRLAALTAGLPKPRTFYEIDATTEIYTVPAGSLYAELLKLAGSNPITTDSSYVISLEKVIAFDPEVILLGDDASYTKAADVAARPGWAGISAVKSGRVIAIPDYVLVTRPGPRLVDGLKALIKALHPEVAP